MKIATIEVENLNSLYGHHRVDLEGDLRGAPLVLITGPTGAGKSTLLDAVGLALFGRTPRLVEPRSNDAALDARSALSRGAGEGSAVVELVKREAGQAVRYRASWRCRRARGRSDGSLQDPVRTLERQDPATRAWQVLASDARVSHYQPPFDEVLEGLTVEDFQRSVLLAQGEFSAFLQADEDERVNLLERLTATGRFRAIGERAAQARADAQRRFDDLSRELAGMALLDPLDRAALEAELDRLARAAQQARDEARRLGVAIGFLEQRDELGRRRDEQVARAERARGALASRAADLARLAEHARCAQAGEVLQASDRAGGDLARAAAEVARLEGASAAAATSLGEAAREAAKASETWREADGSKARAAPEIGRAREARTRLGAALAELDLAREERERAAATAKDLAGRAQQAERLRDRAAEELSAAERAAASLEPSRPILDELAGFAARYASLRRESEELEARGERREEKARAAKKAQAAQAEAARRRGEARQALDVRAEAAAGLARALAAAVGAAEGAPARREALRAALQVAAAREQGLSGLAGLAARRVELVGRLAELDASLARAEAGLSLAAGERPRLESERSALEERSRLLEQDLEDLAFLVRIAQERGRIRPGEECPLCGSARHPYVEDARFAEVDERNARRRKALLEDRAQVLEGREKIQRELSELARRESEGRTTRAALAPQRTLRLQELEGIEAQARAGLASLGLSGPEAVEPERRACAERLGALEGDARGLDEAEARALAAEAARREAESGLAAREQALQAAADELDARRRALAEADDERVRLRGQLAAERASLGADLERHGVPADGGDRALQSLDLAPLGRAIALARERAEAVRACDLELGQAKEQRAQAERGAAEARARATAGAERLASLAAAEEGRRASVEALRDGAAAHLGGEDPDAVEARLESRSEAARQALSRAEAARGRLESALATLRGQLGVETRRREAASGEGARLEGELARALADLGLEGPEALRGRLLATEERAALEAAREALEGAAASAAHLLAARQRDLEELIARRPPELAADASAPALRAAREEREGEAKDLEGRLYAARAQLSEDDARRQSHAERAEALEAARKELDIWERLHGLIGVRDGQQFQRFAQILNLEELIRKANARLSRIAPRYALAPARDTRGEPQLSFAVRDEWHGGAERPITTLSGGESFLVSLALALALADYRAVKMPIETLLLDEGFGTLDRDTLAVAMNALQALTSEGVQIAIISHVEWLRDQIEAQVAVERCGNGRSRVVVSVAGKVAAGAA